MGGEIITDFATLVDTAIARHTRNRLAEFLSQFQYVEFGRTRPLAAWEVALVLTCIDHFLLDDSITELGTTQFRQLRARLNTIAQHEAPIPEEMFTLIRNSCFDALACISALEARLCRTLDRAEVRRAIGTDMQCAENDN